jgi:hypothetical protein
MKKLLCTLTNKISNAYAGMSSNASMLFFFGQAKAPACLVKKD